MASVISEAFPRALGNKGTFHCYWWEHGNISKFLKEQSKIIFGSKGDFGNFYREYGDTEHSGCLISHQDTP